MNKTDFQWKTYWELARPADYVKNVFVLAPLFFAGDFFEGGKCLPAAVALIVFCLLASGGYALNDVLDAQQDRLHPAKQGRPVASGRLGAGSALTAAFLWITAGMAISVTVSRAFMMAGAAYLILQILYSVFMKHWPVVDVLAISAGFILRLLAGGIAVQVYVSIWLIACTSLLALFLAIGKRRCELTIMSHPVDHRRTFHYYTPEVLDLSLLVTGICTISSYATYTYFSRTGASCTDVGLILTIPPAAAGLYRFSSLFRHDCHYRGIMQIIMQDKVLQILLAAWVCMYFAVLYLFHV
jgi:4-hydroxybenzoate polyprenyltransferase